MDTPPQPREKNSPSDLNTVAVTGVIVIGIILYDAIRRIVQLFEAPGAITARVPMPEQGFTADLGAEIPARADVAILTVEGVNPVSAGSFVVAIVVSSLAYVAAAALVIVLCLRMLRGRIFEQSHSRLITAISLLLLGGAIAGIFFENMGLNGLLAAAGGEFTGQWTLLWGALPFYIAAMAVGMLPIVFRRGIRLQHDAEGLV